VHDFDALYTNATCKLIEDKNEYAVNSVTTMITKLIENKNKHVINEVINALQQINCKIELPENMETEKDIIMCKECDEIVNETYCDCNDGNDDANNDDNNDNNEYK
jgi:tRNA U34 5-carboxymethylaminomethyl modifying GTPase MnmE/TrmE